MSTQTAPYRSRQISMWEEGCSNKCKVFDQCGGTFTAPCHCVKTGEDYRDCANCKIICRQRDAPPFGIYPNDTFEKQIREGRALEDVGINQKPPDVPFPLVIPLRTNRLKKSVKNRIVGIQLDQIITKAKNPNIRQALQSKSKANKSYHVSRGTEFIAVLNSNDKYLEALWRMPDRNKFYTALRKIGIKYVTGPTFSIYGEGTRHPASHNVAMLMRHNRIIQELDEQGFIPIPNIYWRGELDIDRWMTWIAANPIYFIARDFSLASKASGEFSVMNRFIEMIKTIKKPLHIFFTGIGIGHAKYLVQEINSIEGHTCTIVSSDPIMKGIAGGEKLRPTSLTYRPQLEMDRAETALFNIEVFEDILYRELHQFNKGQQSLF